MKRALSILIFAFFVAFLATNAQTSDIKRKPKTKTTVNRNQTSTSGKPQVASKQKSQKNISTTVITVKTAAQFLDAIGSNRTIRVEAPFDLTPTLQKYVVNGKIKTINNENSNFTTAGIYAESVYFGGLQLYFYNLHNLTIEGASMATAHIQIDDVEAYVLLFMDCSNIRLRNLTLGHTYNEGCEGGVIGMNSCDKFTIEDCDLYGCGTEGITAVSSDHCVFKNSTIRDCSYSIMTLKDCSDFHFLYSQFIRNQQFDLININDCQKVDFTSCTISQNKGTLFNMNCNVIFKGCTINHTGAMGTTNRAVITR